MELQAVTTAAGVYMTDAQALSTNNYMLDIRRDYTIGDHAMQLTTFAALDIKQY